MRKPLRFLLGCLCTAALMTSAGCQSNQASPSGTTAAAEETTLETTSETALENTSESASENTLETSENTGASSDTASDETEQQEKESAFSRIFGPVTKRTENGITYLDMDNQSQDILPGEVILTIDPDNTLILDAVNGYPASLDDIADGDTVYAYIGPAATLSLPPMVNGTLVFCGIPQDFKVPDYIAVESLTWNSDKTEGILTAAGGIDYTVNSDTTIIPYLTRNIVTLDDLTEGRTCIIWSDDANFASNIVLFPE